MVQLRAIVMMEMLQNLLEAALEVLLAVILGVFGFSWDKPKDDVDADESVVTEIVRLQTAPLYSLNVSVLYNGQVAVSSGCGDNQPAAQLMAPVASNKPEVSAYIT